MQVGLQAKLIIGIEYGGDLLGPRSARYHVGGIFEYADTICA